MTQTIRKPETTMKTTKIMTMEQQLNSNKTKTINT